LLHALLHLAIVCQLGLLILDNSMVSGDQDESGRPAVSGTAWAATTVTEYG
jgi:hypothetical protein